MCAGKFQKDPEHRLRIFTRHGGVQVKHIEADKSLGGYLMFFAKFAPGGRVLHHWQRQRKRKLARLCKKRLLYKTGGTPNMVHQLECGYVLAGKVWQFPQKVAHSALGLAKELGVQRGEFLALHRRHEEDAGVVVVGGEMLPMHLNLSLRIRRHINHREGNTKKVKHGRKGAEVFAQAHRGGGVADEVKALGRLQHAGMIIVSYMSFTMHLTLKQEIA